MFSKREKKRETVAIEHRDSYSNKNLLRTMVLSHCFFVALIFYIYESLYNTKKNSLNLCDEEKRKQ